MCRLFGFRSRARLNVHHSLIDAENALVVQSQAHPHGWGLGYYEGEKAKLVKSSKPAFQDQVYTHLSASLSSSTVIAHVRQATVGKVANVNTHPFRFGNWLFAHNGDVHGFQLLRPYFLEEIPPHLRDAIKGSTDSEHCFYLFLAELETIAGLDGADLESVEEALITCMQKVSAWCRLLKIRKAPCMNVLATNGKLFAATRLGRALLFSTQKVTCRDYHVCSVEPKSCLEISRAAQPLTHLLVASERISEEDLWEEMPNNSIISLDEAFHFRMRQDVVSLEKLEF